MNDIHDNLAPISLTFFTVFDWIIIAVIVGSIAVIVWYIFWHKKESNISEEDVIVKEKKFIPEQFSFNKELKTLKELQQEQQWKIFALEASALIKKILEQKYKTPFEFATGKEIQEIMKHKDISKKQKEELSHFFALIDPVKFAKVVGREENAQEIIEILKDFNTLIIND